MGGPSGAFVADEEEGETQVTQSLNKPDSELIQISERLKKNQLTPQDIDDLQKIIVNVEQAVHQLRASIIE